MTIRPVFFLVLWPISILGCQRYTARPLDFAAHDELLRSRNPTSADVREYAQRLSAGAWVVTATYDPADGLSLEEAEVVALFFNPQLRTARAKARVPIVEAREAGRWEDPHFQLDVERIIESVKHPWVLGGIVNLTLPLSGRLAAEREKLLAEADVERLKVLVEEQRHLAELRASWLEWSATAEQIALTRALIAELDGFVESAEKLRAAGELDPLDARLLRIERLTRSGRLQILEAQGRSAEIDLRSRMGLAPDAAVKLVPSLAIVRRQMPTTRETAAVMQRHPRVLTAQAEYEVAERSLQLEVRRQYPDLSIGGGFGTDEGTERLLGGLGLPLSLWNRNKRAIAEAAATREAARTAAEGEYEQLLADVARASAALNAAAARQRFIETELAPLVDEQLAAARRLGRLGNYNTLVLLQALTAAHDAKFEVVQARLQSALAIARLLALVDTGGGGIGKDVLP
jgi:outer membrane protein TolC